MRNARTDNRKLIPVGRIARPFSIRGGLKIRLDNPASETLCPGLSVMLDFGNKTAPFVVANLTHDNTLYFDGIATRTDAETLVGAVVYVERADFPKLDKNEFYLTDLIGFSALSADGLFGTITGFSSNGPQSLACVATEAGKEALVPMVEPILKEICMDSRRLVFDLPEGLLP